MLQHCVHADETSSVDSENHAHQLRLVELGKAIEKVSWQLILLPPMQAREVCALPNSSTCRPRHFQGANAAMCITLCADGDHLEITSSVHAVICLVQQKSSCYNFNHNALCSKHR